MFIGIQQSTHQQSSYRNTGNTAVNVNLSSKLNPSIKDYTPRQTIQQQYQLQQNFGGGLGGGNLRIDSTYY